MSEPVKGTERIVNVTLDEQSIVRRNADIEHERAVVRQRASRLALLL